MSSSDPDEITLPRKASRSLEERYRRFLRSLSGPPRSRDELMEFLRSSRDSLRLDGEALTMLEGVLEVSEIQARDIMVPRSQMLVVERDLDPTELLRQVV